MKGPDRGVAAQEEYPRLIRSLAPSARREIAPPRTRSDWEERLGKVRIGLRDSFGRVPESVCPLDPEILGTIERPGYAIERLTFQSRPGVRVTANIYRPDPIVGRLPAVLGVHGHWRWARIDPTVQARCIGLAKLGYVCLCVDAFGSGERAIEPGPGTYHGGLVGAMLWPVGTPLLGLQVYDNRRALDYLISRPDVDAKHLAITGASGGGNQTLYAGATDDRLTAVVPVCGIGTLEAYLTAACCVCEVNAGALKYATTGDLLAMMAPRALMVISASRDAFQFSAGEAAKSIAYARNRFRILGQEERLRHVIVESGHDYNRTMREAMYGWLERHLKGRGDGNPVSEPEFKTEDPATLRCYPDGQTRPRTVVTIPQFARMEGLSRIAKLPQAPDHRERWEADSIRMKASLRDAILGGLPRTPSAPPSLSRSSIPEAYTIEIESEPGIRLTGTLRIPRIAGKAGDQALSLLIFPMQVAPAGVPPVKDDGDPKPGTFATLEVELRCTGSRKAKTPAIAGVVDHNESEWGIWVGRPLLGQWVWDLIRWVDAVARLNAEPPRSLASRISMNRLAIAAKGPMSLVAILAAAFDERIETILVEACPTSFVSRSGKAWSSDSMAVACPNILEVGDVGQLAALVAPRPLRIRSASEPDGQVASPDRIREAFQFAEKVYRTLHASPALRLGDRANGT